MSLFLRAKAEPDSRFDLAIERMKLTRILCDKHGKVGETLDVFLQYGFDQLAECVRDLRALLEEIEETENA